MPETSYQQAQTLIEAVKNHDEKKVKSLIAEKVDVNHADRQGRTALLCAVQNNVDIEIIKALVENGGAQINAVDRNNRSSLFYAVTKSTDTASYLFEKACTLDDSVVSSIFSFFIEKLCERHDFHPTIDEVLSLLKAKCQKPKKLAKEIVNILVCKISLLLTSVTDSQRPRNSHTMFHLQGKTRKTVLDVLNEVSKSEYLQGYKRKEEIKDILTMVEGGESISKILEMLKKHKPNPLFADSYGNTAVHYAACLPWMGVPKEIAIEICKWWRSFGGPLDKRNHEDQTPLLFCLSQSMRHLKEEDKVTAMETLVEVCQFLLDCGSSLDEQTRSGESVFHLVMELFQQGFEIPDEAVRQSVTDEALKLLGLFECSKEGTPVVQKRAGESLNSPLHCWASLVLTVPDYTRLVTQKHTFKGLLEVIFNHLLKCGALTNDRNKDEETPLHVCKTWSAVTLLIADKDVNLDVKDSLERPPLLAAASKKTFLINPSHFYPDFQEDADSFYETAVEEKKLDPWTVDKCNNSVLGFLIASRTYDLSKALVDFACTKESYHTSQIFASLLSAICKDVSLRTKWKVKLVETVLSCAKEKKIDAVKEPFNVCCETMLSQCSGTADDEPPPSKNGAAGESSGAAKEREDVQEELEQNENHKIEKSLHLDIAKILRSHGAELSGKSYKKLKSKCKEIDKLLQNTEVQFLLPWTSISKRHEDQLEQVAKRQECQEIGESICCHKVPMGSYGPNLFVGINKLNSKEVTIKRIKCIREPQDRQQEMMNLYANINCEQVIRYFFPIKDRDNEYVHIVFELMEGNLEDYVDGDAFDSSKGTSLCRDILNGLNYLHTLGIRHFQDHLKPRSVFYKTSPKLCLKITDFDDSQNTSRTSTYISLSPEVLEEPKNHSNSSDMFSCGLLMHFILTKGEHPFCPPDCSSKSESDIIIEMRDNIRNALFILGDDLAPEATHLLRRMLDADKSKRPFADKALNHPFFWCKEKKMDLLTAVGNQTELEYSRAGRSFVLSAFETDLETQFGTVVNRAKWNDLGYTHMPDIYKEMKKRRKYDTRSVVELVRFIRNAIAHVSEDTRPKPIRKLLLENFVFLEYFPNLVIEVYKAVTKHRWDQTREEIKYRM